MPRKENRSTAACPHSDQHETQICYDVPNDEYFVACMVCGCEGQRTVNEKQAKIAWTKRQGLREMELI